MKKTEFLDTLRLQLTGEIAVAEIEDTIRYYDSYILDAVRNGQTEEDVLEQLGDPRLIAHTIIDTSKTETRTVEDVYQSDDGEQQEQFRYRSYDMSSLGAKIAVAAIIVVVLLVLFLLLRVVFMFAVPLLMIALIISIFRRGGRG